MLPSGSIVWDQANIDILKELDKKWSQAIEFFFSQVNEGYIIEFSIKYSDYFNADERNFEQGPRKQMLEDITLWMKMLFV
jgi:hypothetical protein